MIGKKAARQLLEQGWTIRALVQHGQAAGFWIQNEPDIAFPPLAAMQDYERHPLQFRTGLTLIADCEAFHVFDCYTDAEGYWDNNSIPVEGGSHHRIQHYRLPGVAPSRPYSHLIHAERVDDAALVKG